MAEAQEQSGRQQEQAGRQQSATAAPQSMAVPERERGVERYAPERGIERPWLATPFSLMRRLAADMDQFFARLGLGPLALTPLAEQTFGRGAWWPRVDLFQRSGQIVVRADLPGMRDEDIRVQVDGDVLTISGERRETLDRDEWGVHHSECRYGSFQRSIPLPRGVELDKVQANFENGVLEVTAPMPPQKKPQGRQISIQAKSGAGAGKAQKVQH